MIYFKHPELSENYHVSLKTIHNWIDSAKIGKVNLKLHTSNNRTYIANTPENIRVLADLAEKGKKYRNTLHHKIIEPKPEFYDTLTHRQILDIITSLNTHKEIPGKYNYLHDGALYWDEYIKRIEQEEKSTHTSSETRLSGTRELLRMNMEAIKRLLAKGKRINIIDLGSGNGYPVRELLSYFVENEIPIHRYIAIDISPDMLAITKKNITQWHGNDFPFESYVRDLTYEQFDDLLVNDMLTSEGSETINLVLLLGGTLTGLRSYSSALRTIYGSMTTNDLIIYTDKPDTEASRQYFNFNDALNTGKKAPDEDSFILSMLNIDESLYDTEMGFDKDTMMRYIRIKLKTSITIKFQSDGINRNVSLEKGESILLLRIRHMSALEMTATFQQVGFTLLQSSLTADRQHFLSISGVEIKQATEE